MMAINFLFRSTWTVFLSATTGNGEGGPTVTAGLFILYFWTVLMNGRQHKMKALSEVAEAEAGPTMSRCIQKERERESFLQCFFFWHFNSGKQMDGNILSVS